MSAVVDFVGDVVGDVADVTFGAVEDVLDFAVEQIIEPVAEVVTDTLEKAIDDPIGTLAMAASIAFPPMAPLIMGANTIVHGGSLEDALLSAGTAYVGGQIAQGVSGELATSLDYGTTIGSEQTAMLAAQNAGMPAAASLGSTVGNIAGNVASTTVRGGDPLAALIAGGVGAGVGELTSQIEGFSQLPPAAQNAIRTTMAAELQGRDPSNALMNIALNAGINEAQNYTPAPSTGNGSVDFSDYPVQDFGEGNVEQYLSEYQQNMLDIAENGGYTSQWVPDEQGNRTLTSDDGSTITVDPFGDVIGTTQATDTPYVAPPKAGLPTINISAGTTGAGGVAGTAPTSGLAAAPQSNQQPTTIAASSPLTAGVFSSKVLNNKFEDPLAAFQRLQQGDQSQPAPNQNLDQMSKEMPTPFYTYGREQSIDDIFKNLTGYASFAEGGLATPLMAGGGATGTRHGKYAAGGLSTPMVAAGGKMRVDFRGGDAVTGEGDGQSDDIPAMLADGEFVFPADVVAAIGNGSTKAGSDKLYDMMHGIRSHVRSAKPKDLPPEIKSPLAFLKFNKARG